MKDLLSKIPFIGNFFVKENDWHNPNYILKVINENELISIRERVLSELKKEDVINPKGLYYLRKYIDASFNKKTVNIEGRFIEKQNELEQLYATGKSKVYESIAEYDERLKKAVLALEPNSERVVNKDVVYEDDSSFNERFNKLPESLKWR